MQYADSQDDITTVTIEAEVYGPGTYEALERTVQEALDRSTNLTGARVIAHREYEAPKPELVIEATKPATNRGIPIVQGDGFTKLVKHDGYVFIEDGDGDAVRLDNVEAIVEFLTA